MRLAILAVVLLLLPQDPDEQTLRRLAARSGSEIDWPRSWADAAARAARENKLVLVLFESYGGLVPIEGVQRAGLLTDADVLDLVRERFVPLEAKTGADLPLPDYALGPRSFGGAALFVTPQGKVVDEIPALGPIAFYARAVDVLKKHGKPSDGRDAAACLRRGDLDRAAELLKAPASARDWMLKSSLCRRLLRGDDALEALRGARAANPTAAEEKEIALDEALILLWTGKAAQAEPKLKAWTESYADHPRVPEAVYWLAAWRQVRNDEEGARPLLRWLLTSHPESRWAWKVAAGRLLEGVVAARGRRIEWPTSRAMATVARCQLKPLPVSEAGRAGQDAIGFLLQTQDEDGAWVCPPETGGSEQFKVATAAICLRGLLPFRDRDKVAKAADRALAFLLEPRTLDLLWKQDDSKFNYVIWDHIAVLWALAGCAQAGVGDKKALLPAMSRIVATMARTQQRTGGWTYAKGMSMSFVTAGAVLAFLEARAAGAEIDARMLKAALDGLAQSRREDGTFTYFAAAAAQSGRGADPEAAARSPGCALALQKGRGGDWRDIQRAIDSFVAHRKTFSSERGKTILHTGPQGQGSHYLFYDYSLVASAIRALPADRRGPYRAALLEVALAARMDDGSFEDSPVRGRAAATGQALHALHELGCLANEKERR